MIKVTGLDSKEFVINADNIERLEQIPESLIVLTNGKKYLVKEPVDEIINKVLEYKRKIFTQYIK
ncbi:flagellar FlbD family protein [Clostridium sp. JN-1]|jgi:flagellar protein FlbD|uniref:flagellar FlbD family protein n=1 Tax=Clostridium sp. JN-1 TaxID=2483110 RepID=UPI000F0B04FC|nr:flagellar FlbD family protein [Clostridium sp. JN-1]